MILGFNKRFVQPIQDGIKKHTIREDKTNRWKAGIKIQLATGVRTKQYSQFNTGTCVSTQAIVFKWHDPTETAPDRWCNILVATGNGSFKRLSYQGIERLAINDGFESVNDLFKWFNKDFTGKIVHWTLLRY